jgi:fructose-1-phosphate kinase PfkB-like protein
MARCAHAAGARFVADCDGEPLRIAVSLGCDLLVPNQHEAGRLLGRIIGDVAAAATAAIELAGAAAPTVAITLGAAGAVLAHGGRCWHAQPPALEAGSAVGAGDAFLAALLSALDGGLRHHALRRAVAAGTATLLSTGSNLLETRLMEQILPDVDLTEVER